MKGLEEQLLGRVIMTEKQELEAERTALIEDVTSNKKKMKELEDNLLYKLTSTKVIYTMYYILRCLLHVREYACAFVHRFVFNVCVCVCMRACVRACVRAFVHAFYGVCSCEYVGKYEHVNMRLLVKHRTIFSA